VSKAPSRLRLRLLAGGTIGDDDIRYVRGVGTAGRPYQQQLSSPSEQRCQPRGTGGTKISFARSFCVAPGQSVIRRYRQIRWQPIIWWIAWPRATPCIQLAAAIPVPARSSRGGTEIAFPRTDWKALATTKML
jgi:hypothetical protein